MIGDGCALLQGFGGSYQTDDQSLLDAEMASLEDVLQREWHFSESVSQELDCGDLNWSIEEGKKAG